MGFWSRDGTSGDLRRLAGLKRDATSGKYAGDPLNRTALIPTERRLLKASRVPDSAWRRGNVAARGARATAGLPITDQAAQDDHAVATRVAETP
jgi:hypothetical protein